MTATDPVDMTYYTAAPVDAVTRLRRFRMRCPLSTHAHDGHQWTYYKTGSGEPLLLLPGGGADAEAMFPYIEALAEHFTVIALNFPSSLRGMDSAANGILGIARQEGLAGFHLFGGSFGGMVAQIVMRRAASMVGNIVLAHTTVPSEKIAEQVAMQRTFMRVYPNALLMALMRRSVHRELKSARLVADDDDRAFWHGYFEEAYRTRIRRKHLLARAHVTVDYHRNFRFQSSDLDSLTSRMLIIEASGDEVIDEGQRGALTGHYPGAYVQTLWGYSHLSLLIKAGELAASTLRFLLQGEDDELPDDIR